MVVTNLAMLSAYLHVPCFFWHHAADGRSGKVGTVPPLNRIRGGLDVQWITVKHFVPFTRDLGGIVWLASL